MDSNNKELTDLRDVFSEVVKKKAESARDDNSAGACRDHEDYAESLARIRPIENSRMMSLILLLGMSGSGLRQKKISVLLGTSENNVTTYFRKLEEAGFLIKRENVGKRNNPSEIDRRAKTYVIDYSGKGFQALLWEILIERGFNRFSISREDIACVFSQEETEKILSAAGKLCCSFSPGSGSRPLLRIKELYDLGEYSPEDIRIVRQEMALIEKGVLPALIRIPLSFYVTCLFPSDTGEFRGRMDALSARRYDGLSNLMKRFYSKREVNASSSCFGTFLSFLDGKDLASLDDFLISEKTLF